jgi:hypothetical protein
MDLNVLGKIQSSVIARRSFSHPNFHSLYRGINGNKAKLIEPALNEASSGL